MKRRQTIDLIRSVSRVDLIPHRFRAAILRAGGISIGHQTLLLSGTKFVRYGSVTIGDGVFISYDCFFDADSDISIGNRVSVADHVRLITSTHELGEAKKRAGKNARKPIKIEDGTWIGSGVTVLPGVTIGSACVIAAGSVVTQDCAPNSLYAGIPAVRKRAI